jgi:CYTH domain-containing protein
MPHAAVVIDARTAEALCFPKPEYMAVELERRWVSNSIPADLVVEVETIIDLYVTDSQLRLREATFRSGAAPMRRLTRKVDLDPTTRLMTSIYLPEKEFRQFARVLPGTEIRKLRHRLAPIDGVAPLIDEFQGTLKGLLVAEVEFASRDLLVQYVPPSYFGAEITSDERYRGGSLAQTGLPS